MGWLGTWAKRKAIKYGTVFPGSNLTDFPLLLQIAGDTDIGGELSAQKFAVTLADGTTTVPYGAVSYSDSGSSLTANLRAKFSPLTGANTGDVMGYLYYDDAQTDTEDKANVLDSNCKGYWPLEESPAGSAPQFVDWTSNNNDGTAGGSGGSSVSAEVANGLSCGGSRYATLANAPSGSLTAFSLSVVAKLSGSQSSRSYPGLISGLLTGSTANFGLAIRSDNDHPYFEVNRSGVTAAVTAGSSANDSTLHQYDATWDGSNIRFYIDGALVGSPTAFTGTPAISGSLFIGCRGTAAVFDGICDEAFYDEGAARSANWIAYRYQNQFHNSDTVTLGTEELLAGTFTASAAVSCSAATCSGSATFAGGTHTTSGAVTTTQATASGSATFAGGTHTASGAVTTTQATASGSATFAGGTHMAAGAVTTTQATVSGSANFGSAVRTAAGAVTTTTATAAGSATFGGGTHTASGAVTTTQATASGSATFSFTGRVGSGAVQAQAATASGTATFAAGTHTATLAVSVSRAIAAAAATFTASPFTAASYPSRVKFARSGLACTFERASA